MDLFTRYAQFTLTRDTVFVALAAATLMVGFSFDLPLALDIAAYIALGFSLLLLFRALCLTERRIVRTEPWRGLEPEERPEGETGLRLARDEFEGLLLAFAKTASGTACALFISALVISSL